MSPDLHGRDPIALSSGEMVRATVLVVDDDPGFRGFLRAALETSGFQVEEAADGPTAVARALELRPDVVLLDWRMPGQSGIDACRDLRRHPELRTTRIAMVTGLDDERDRHLARHAGADAFVVKDGDPGAMAFQVRRLLTPRRAAS
jgi:DNA-binding response OmpR family regulator